MLSTTTLVAVGLDIITLGLIVLAVWRGYVNGFIKSVYHLLYFAAAIVLTHLFYPYTVKILNLTHVTEKVSAVLANLIKVPDLPDTTSAISSLALPEALKTRLIENNNYEIYQLFGVDTVGAYINAYLTNMVINAMAILLTFVVLLLLLKLVEILLGIIDHLPVVRQLNHFLGSVFGLGSGILYVFLFCLLLTAIGAYSRLSIIYPAISKSLLTQIFYEHNLLLDSLLKIFTT